MHKEICRKICTVYIFKKKAVFTFKKWQSTPGLLPGKSHGQRSLVGYSPWGRKESDTTERLHFTLYFFTLIAEEGFLISSCYSRTLPSDAYISPFLLGFSLLFFSQLFVRPPQTAILLFAFLFHGDGLDPCLLYNVTNLSP